MDKSTLLTELAATMSSVKRLMMRSRDVMLGDLQLTKTQVEIVMLLHDKDDQTVGDLADSLGVTQSAATQTIETLVKRDLIARVADQNDRRMVRIQLAPAGAELAGQLHAHRAERMRTLFEGLSNEELLVMTNVLRRLEHQLRPVKETKEGN